jgi:alkylation response protein AidB-like acyl-CoA dehydrogenase
MNLSFSEADEEFRAEVRAWLAENLADFPTLVGRAVLGDMDHDSEALRLWNKRLADGGWVGIGWPAEVGGRGVSLHQEVIFNEEYARARAPGRLGHIGETLLAPTVIAFGTPEQKARFLPPILAGDELWCQGYSEPGAGSDLANVQCRAELVGDEWVISGQKVWTSHASEADWCFCLCRTDTTARKHRGISYILVPMRQPGVEIVPIRQMTGDSEFAEVFFDGAKAHKDHVLGPVNGGWKVAMATLAFERGASTLGQQQSFKTELDHVIEVAKKTGRSEDPGIRDRAADLWMRLEVMRLNALRTLSAHHTGELPRAAYINKLYWANWHRELGELAMDVLGDDCVESPEDSQLHRLFLWSRCDTIYAGTNEIQRNLIAQRALGLPR